MDSLTPPVPSHALAEARALAGRRDWIGLAARLRDVPEDAFAAEPELGYLYADACRRGGDTVTALRIASRAEPEARRSGDQRLVVRLVNLLGMTCFESGRMPDAEAHWEELLNQSSNLGDDEFVARASNGLGVVAHVRGRRDVALTYYQRALAGYTRTGNQRGLAQTHYNLGLSFRDLGFDADADSHYQRATALAQATESEEVIALAEVERAWLRARQGDGRLAASMAERAGERFKRVGDPTGYAQALRVLASAFQAQGNDADAAVKLDEALAIAREHEDAVLRSDVQRDRGLLLRDLGRLPDAREALQDAAANFEQMGSAAEAEAVRTIAAGLAQG